MENGLLKKAIENFKKKRLGVYKADPDQVIRDARGAQRAAKDHVGRWLFELLQNSEDARATMVRIIIDKDTIYIADNGQGLKPEAVDAICGTDFSDKSTGTIGRKGVGFKSVYEVSQNPQVLIVNGEGIEFSPARAKDWLKKHNLKDDYIPYQWIPFFISWEDIVREDTRLVEFKAYKTVVRLCDVLPEKREKAKQLVREWPPHALFAFRHVRQIKAPSLEIILTPGNGIWLLSDSRGETPAEWRVARYVEHPKSDLLESLGADERRAISQDGVSFLIAAPFENDIVVPTRDYLPVHVFYPTEQKGPVRLLLHAEFLVKSDRTALVPFDSSPFNRWVADRLGYHVCKFVNASYRQEAPSSHAALLVPFGDRASHPVAEALWQYIVNEARRALRLADIAGKQRLKIDKAKLITVSVRPDLGRIILEYTDVREQLLHSTFDEDKEARKALKELGCEEIRDQALRAAIAENAYSLAAETKWVWACWEWLAAWVSREPYREEHEKRIEQVGMLPIVPISGSLVKPSDLASRIVTWKPDAGVNDLPNWLPLTFVDDWFRDRIENEVEQESLVKELSEELGISGPDADIIQRAVGRAIEQYWKDKHGDPGRFLRFILEQDWHETAEVLPSLRRCPVPLSQPVDGEIWGEASKSYFGREWGNDLLADLYEGRDGVAWVQRMVGDENAEKKRSTLKWLSVAECPRVIDDPGGQAREIKRVVNALPYHTAHDTIPVPKTLEHVDVMKLVRSQAIVLVSLLAKHWTRYYEHYSTVSIRYRYYGWYYCSVDSYWWHKIKKNLKLPLKRSSNIAPMIHCWLPNKRTERAIGELLPMVDVDAFGNNKDAVQDWLIGVVGLHKQIEQLTGEEWKALLSKHIPEKAPAEHLVLDERLRDKVLKWYTACLETMANQDNVLDKIFASCPLLCQKGGVWQYVEDEPRYLSDDNDLATAFGEDVWLIHIPIRLVNDAVKYFDVSRLSEAVQMEVKPGEPSSPLSGELEERFKRSIPYVWAWRSSQSKQTADRLTRLKSLEVLVVPTLEASLSLDGLYREVSRRWHVDNNTIYLHKDHANETELAQALAKVLDIRSEADFYENLFRCTDDRKRKEKLLSKGVVDAEIDSCLREYSRSSDEEEQNGGHCGPKRSKQDSNTSRTSSGIGDRGQYPPEQPSAGQPGEISKGTPSVFPQRGKQPLGLKDPSTTPYVLGIPPGGGTRKGGSGEVGGREREVQSLTDVEKVKLEEAGRTFATRELERIGYTVEQMPRGNPGFDLRAKKGKVEIHVEVKAHIGRATVVEVTQREYKEYLTQRGYRWELWNVEHLEEDDLHPVVITRYDQIPFDALDVRTFRVDLKKCKSCNIK